MTHPRSAAALAAALLCIGSAASQAQPSGASPVRSEALIKALEGCRALSDSAARLACYDGAAARLLTAERAGEVVVVDRTQARAARRQAFGFSMPSLDMFKRGEPETELNRVQFTLARATRGPDGKWILRTSEGQVWRQTDQKVLTREPRAGSKAEVRNAAMGSFFMNIDGQTAIRVRREQ